MVCHCADCRAAQLWLDRPDPPPHGVDLFQTTPDIVHFTQGRDALGLLRLSPRGLLRWYATCCGAPLFNTPAHPRLALAALHVERLADPSVVGKVRAEGFLPRTGGGYRHKNAARMAWGVFRRMIAAGLSGRWRQTPFFDPATGQPVATATIPDRAARARPYPRGTAP